MNRPPVSSRAALSEIERQRDRLRPPLRPSAAASGGGGAGAEGGKAGAEPEKKGGSSKGSGRKDDVQRNPEDQKGRADPKEGEGRGAE